MYRIKMLCFDPGISPYEDEPAGENAYETYEEAFERAWQLAEDECEYLNDGCDDCVSFGVVLDEDAIRVNYYYIEENDTTGNTEVVTVYWVYKEEDN